MWYIIAIIAILAVVLVIITRKKGPKETNKVAEGVAAPAEETPKELDKSVSDEDVESFIEASKEKPIETSEPTIPEPAIEEKEEEPEAPEVPEVPGVPESTPEPEEEKSAEAPEQTPPTTPTE